MLPRAEKLFYDFVISSGIMFNSCFITIHVRDSLLVTYVRIGCQVGRSLFRCLCTYFEVRRKGTLGHISGANLLVRSMY